MAGDNFLSTLEQTLKQTKAVRARLLGRLTELEEESASLRSELRELDHLTAQTEAAMRRLLSGSLSAAGSGLDSGYGDRFNRSHRDGSLGLRPEPGNWLERRGQNK